MNFEEVLDNKSEDVICGIYIIKNEKNNKVYIGQSTDIYNRWKQHVRDLKSNRHHSRKLQRAWNKTKNKKIFNFKILEIIDENILDFEEDKYINEYDSYNNGYNCTMVFSTIEIIKEKRIKNLNKQIRIDSYYNEWMELYDKYKDNIIISKSYLDRMNSKYYKEKQYVTVLNLINEYIKYFNLNYKIRLFSNRYIIEINENNYLISYEYKVIKNKFILVSISKNYNNIIDINEFNKYKNIIYKE